MGSVYLDGRDSCLYMKFNKILPSAQGMDVWGDRAFVLYDTGGCAVYDLKTRNELALAQFSLGSYNAGTPTKDYLNHANSCMFSGIHYKGNPIPLLYVVVGTGVGADEDGFYYRCAVENITMKVDEQGKESYSAETIQVISYRPEGIENVPFEAPCWGCPAFFADTENQALYIFSARYRTKRGCVPDGESNAYIITKFRLPQVDEGTMIHLKPSDIQEQFCVESDVLFTQGGTLSDNKIYYTAIQCPRGEFSKQFALGEGNKQVCVYLPWSMAVEIQELSLDDGAWIKPIKAAKKLLAFGDSITQGYDALRPSNRYAAKLAEALGAEEINKGIGAERFFPALAEAREPFEPDYITVAYGTNDWSRLGEEEFKEKCQAFYAALNRNYPNSRIFAITPIWRKDYMAEKKFGSFHKVSEDIKNIVKEFENITCIHGFGFVPQDEKYFADLRLHPNDEGFEEYFRSIYREILPGEDPDKFSV